MTEQLVRNRNLRKWRITCATGQSMRTEGMNRGDALAVASHFDRTHPECAPHAVESREKRTWSGRQVR